MLITLIEDYNIRLLSTKIYWEQPKDREEYKKFWDEYNKIDKKTKEGRQIRKQTVHANELRDNRNAVLVMDELIAVQEFEVRKAEEAVEKARAKLTEIMQERKMHEKLKEKALLQFLEEEKAAESKVVDELTSYTYGQRGKENGNGS